MKGLIRNNLYSMENSILIAFIISVFLAIVPFGGVNPTLLPMIISIQIFVFVVNIGTSLRADETAKWSKFELTLPIKRSNLVLAKYVSIIILILMGIVMGTATMVLSSYYDYSVNYSALVYGFEYGLTLSILSTSIMYPLSLKLGAGKSEIIFIISAFATIGIMLLIAAVLSTWTEGMNLRHPLVGAVSIIVAIVAFVLSYFVSVIIHSRKEF